MTEENTNFLFQIIDGDGEFAPKENLESQVKKYKINDIGFDYYVVAVLGCQSSGKSTLLNLLFGTQFLVMDSQQGRSQTTKGVWMGLSKSESPKEEKVFVFDVEGTDSRERGEHHASFEQKTSLFSLALAEILIVNMWHNDIGRYNAGNLALLKTVFELNLQLFQQSRGTKKTLILFVIRDHVPQETPLEKLKSTLQTDMHGIWKDLIKPKGYEGSKVDDFFDFEYTALPHKILAQDQFVASAKNLRKRFLDPSQSDYIVGKEYLKDIPSDGFMAYASSIWKVIKENKDLNLPTQKEMLAKYRCDEISAEIFAKFSEDLQPLRNELAKNQILVNFGKQGTDLLNEAKKAYAEPSSRYHPEVAKKTGETLAVKILTELNSLFVKQLKLVSQKATSSFSDGVKEAMPDNKPAISDFTNVINQIYTKSIDFFQSKVKESIVETADNWSFEEELQELQNSLKEKIQQIKQDQLTKLMKELKDTCNQELSKPLERLLDVPNPEMWSKIREIYNKTKENTSKQLEERLNGFEISKQEIEQKLQAFEDSVFQVLKDRFLEKSKYVDYVMNKRFENIFNTDDSGLPRRWKPKDDIAAIFAKSKEQALVVLEQFAFLRLTPELDSVEYLKDDSKVEQELVIMTFEQCKNVLEKFEKDAKTSYMQAIRDQEAVSTSAHIPVWAIIMIFFLGFNEFIHVLTSPFLLFLSVIVGVGLYAVYFLNLGGPQFKLVIQMMQSSVTQTRQYVLEQYDQQQHQKRIQDSKKDN